jgi:hypothetical protein
VGPILDLAVVLLALAVIVSLCLLAWTLGVSAVRAVRQSRVEVAGARRRLAAAERRLTETNHETVHYLRQLASRTASPWARERGDASGE